MMRRSRTRSARTTRRRSLTSATRWRSSTRSRRRWKEFATQSSPSCMLTLAAPQEECPEACLTWEAWVVHLVLELLEELAVLDLPSRRWTNLPNLTGFTDSSGVEQRSVDSKHVKLKP